MNIPTAACFVMCQLIGIYQQTALLRYRGAAIFINPPSVNGKCGKMAGKIRILSRDGGRITFDLKDAELSGRYTLELDELELDDKKIFERIYHNNMLVPTGRAQYIAAALAGVIKSKIQEI